MALGRKQQSDVTAEQSQDVESEAPVSGEIEIPIPEGVTLPTLPGESFAELAGQLTGMTSARDLIKVKEGLVGVPMILTSFTFRWGAKPKDARFGDYVSVEAVTYDNRRVVFNDSSTGVRKQVAEYLKGIGVLTEADDPAQPFQTWDSDNLAKFGTWRGELEKSSFRIESEPGGVAIRFLCRHGLRKSAYFAEAVGKDAVTYYLD